MKFGKPNEKSIKRVGLQILGFALGAMAGRAGMAALHDDSVAGTDDEINKNKILGYAKRGGLAIAGGAAAASITSDDDASVIAKSAGVGFAAIQVIDGVTEVASKNATTVALTTGTKMQRIAGKALGLACPCSDTVIPMMRPRNNRGLKSPAYVENANDAPYGNGNFFQLAMAN